MTRLRSYVVAAAIVATLAGAVSTAEAGSWVFMTSPLSDAPPQSAAPSPAARARGLGGPYFTRPRGAYVQVGRRNLQSTISIKGQTVDRYNLWENWIQDGGQF